MKTTSSLVMVATLLGFSSAQAAVWKCVTDAQKTKGEYLVYVTDASSSSQNVLIANPSIKTSDPVIAHFRFDKNDIETISGVITSKVNLQVGEQSQRQDKAIFGTRLSMLHDIHIFTSNACGADNNPTPASLRADFRPGRSRAEPISSALKCSSYNWGDNFVGDSLHDKVLEDLGRK